MSYLDSIIFEIPASRRQEFKEHHVVIVDGNTGELLEDSYFDNFFKKKKYYVLDRNTVALDVPGPEVAIRYSNSPNPFIIKMYYRARILEKGIHKLIRAVYQYGQPVDAINARLKKAIEGFSFSHTDFVKEFRKHQSGLEDLIIRTAEQCGLQIIPSLHPVIGPDRPESESFVNCDYKVLTKTKDAQMVEISHFVTLTLSDSFKLKLAGIEDVSVWVKKKLDQFTNNAIIEKTYADVLTNLQESIIRGPMEKACQDIGYELRQIVSAPGLEIEKFYFETADKEPYGRIEYMTKDQRLKIALNFIINGRLSLQDEKTKKHIKPGNDIIAGLKRDVIEYARLWINNISPDECFTKRHSFETELEKQIRNKLQANYGFKELGITIKFLENDLSLRLDKLKERIPEIELLGNWTERKYAFYYKVSDVSDNGWYQFRTNNYKDTDTELNDVSRLIKNTVEDAIMRTAGKISGKLIADQFELAKQRVSIEFGLSIRYHDINQKLSDAELSYANMRKDEIVAFEAKRKLLAEAEINEMRIMLREREMAIDAGDEEGVKKANKKLENHLIDLSNIRDRFIQDRTDTGYFLGQGSGPSTEDK